MEYFQVRHDSRVAINERKKSFIYKCKISTLTSFETPLLPLKNVQKMAYVNPLLRTIWGQPFFQENMERDKVNIPKRGSSCGSVGRAVMSDTRCPRFEDTISRYVVHKCNLSVQSSVSGLDIIDKNGQIITSCLNCNLGKLSA